MVLAIAWLALRRARVASLLGQSGGRRGGKSWSVIREGGIAGAVNHALI
jgi:hypothetical protein